jgi:EAL domain-containing protein (putative c-di-GMP-specific phosphodiesterase class I)
VQGLSDNKPDCAAIVRAVADLGASLEVPTIAEGVETAKQLEQVRAAGCKEVQGFLFSRPLPAGEIAAVIARHKRSLTLAA